MIPPAAAVFDPGEVVPDKMRVPKREAIPEEEVRVIAKSKDMMMAAPVTAPACRRRAGRERGDAERGDSRECEDAFAKHGVAPSLPWLGAGRTAAAHPTRNQVLALAQRTEPGLSDGFTWNSGT
jgi:hypothetical protein